MRTTLGRIHAKCRCTHKNSASSHVQRLPGACVHKPQMSDGKIFCIVAENLQEHQFDPTEPTHSPQTPSPKTKKPTRATQSVFVSFARACCLQPRVDWLRRRHAPPLRPPPPAQPLRALCGAVCALRRQGCGVRADEHGGSFGWMLRCYWLRWMLRWLGGGCSLERSRGGVICASPKLGKPKVVEGGRGAGGNCVLDGFTGLAIV